MFIASLIVLITLTYVGFLVRDTDHHFFLTVLSIHRYLFDLVVIGALLFGIAVLILALLVVGMGIHLTAPLWLVHSVFLVSFAITIIRVHKRSKRDNALSVIVGDYYKYQKKWQYGDTNEMDYQQVKLYVRDCAKRLSIYSALDVDNKGMIYDREYYHQEVSDKCSG